MLRVLILGLIIQSAQALDFNQAIKRIKNHEIVGILNDRSSSELELAKKSGSWGDPKLKLAAKNFPKDSLKDDETPMTGVEIALSQKISLTNKFGKKKAALSAKAKSTQLMAKNQSEILVAKFWKVVIDERRLQNELKILNENYAWLNNILKVSKKLYSNGRTSQQAILEVQIRLSEVEIEIENLKTEISNLHEDIKYYLNLKNESFNFKTIPWKLLTEQHQQEDFKELSYKEIVAAKDHLVTSKKLNYIPDITVAIGYTKRSDIDNRGDFVSASITMPLPFSDDKYAQTSQAIYERHMAKKVLRNYQNDKERNQKKLNQDISKLSRELNILNKRTIQYARSARSITAKSYSLGSSSYLELLQSELKLQQKLLKRVRLTALRDKKKVERKLVLGDKLYE